MKIPSVALLVLGLMALMPFSLAIQKGEPYKGYTFGLVIDAGSSGSRLHVYRWDDRIFHEVPPNLSIPVEIDSFKLSVEPGVDMVEGRTKLQSMINDTQKNLTSRGISKERLATFPLYLKATAGLRVLNQTRREDILSKVRTLMAQFSFDFKPENARVISGEEEGVFGWITVQYLQNNLPTTAKVGFQLQNSTTNSSYFKGAIDLGGASTQLTFTPNSSILSNLFNVKLAHSFDKNVYTHSFLYYGQQQFIFQTNTKLYESQQPGKQGNVSHPCFLKGMYLPESKEDVNYVPGVGYVNVVGSGDAVACAALVQKLLRLDTPCMTDPLPLENIKPTGESSTCSINGVYQPPIGVTKKLIAFGAFDFTWRFFNLTNDDTLRSLNQSAKGFCGLNWNDAKNEFPGVPAKFLQLYCLSGTYIYHLLHNGYRIGDNENPVEIPDDSDNYTWTLGSMIYDVNALTYQLSKDSSKGKAHIENSFKISTAVVSAVLGAMTIIVLVIWYRRRKRAPGPSSDNILMNTVYHQHA